MSYEYVKLNPEELTFTQKNFLQSQLDLLEATKAVRNYQKLRREEFMFKIALKTKVDQLKQSITLFNQLLPKAVEPEKRHIIKLSGENKKDLSLDQEIDLIKQKLSKIGAN
ncbi:MAG: hypothetical protein WCK29_04005 [archaeon]